MTVTEKKLAGLSPSMMNVETLMNDGKPENRILFPAFHWIPVEITL
jgi:hypothetical protein